MMAVGAFNQVQGALRWFVDNYCQRIADWRASLHRVIVFDEALKGLRRNGSGRECCIEIKDHPAGKLAFSNVSAQLLGPTARAHEGGNGATRAPARPGATASANWAREAACCSRDRRPGGTGTICCRRARR